MHSRCHSQDNEQAWLCQRDEKRDESVMASDGPLFCPAVSVFVPLGEWHNDS